MTLLAWPALLLLLAAGVLLALATLGSGPRQRDVGTLMIWKRVAAKRDPTRQRRRKYDLLLWFCLSAVLLGSLAAARPGLARTETEASIAVFVEPTGPGGRQHDFADVKSRAEAQAAGRFVYFMAGGADVDGGVRALPGGPIAAQLAQYERAAVDFDARILFLNAPAVHADRIGLVLPRVTEARNGVVYEVRTLGDRVIVKGSTGTSLDVKGAELLEVNETGREASRVYRATQDRVVVSLSDGESLELRRRVYVVGVGTQWNTPAHSALYEALQVDDATGQDAKVWLGSEDLTPAIRLNLGGSNDLAGGELSFDPQHALFRDLPLREFDWLAAGRVMPLDPDARPLLRVLVDGEPVGDIVRQRGDVLEFAADPFTGAPIAAGALLLDNALGVLTGERPSERETYEVVGEAELPPRRAALAAPFPPQGELDVTSQGKAEPLEFAGWLMLVAALAVTGAAVVVGRKKTPGSRRGF